MKLARPDLAPLEARRELWLLVSAAYVDPYYRERFGLLGDSEFRRRAMQAAALLAQEHPAIALGPGEVDSRQLSPQNLFTALDAESAGLETTYRQFFGLTAISPSCPACEVEYEPNTEVTYRSQRLADIAGFYQAFGLQISNRVGERLDHITAEAEFLYVLLAKETVALEEGNQEGAEVCREARRKFFGEHVGWWLPSFARLLSRTAPAGYYQTLAQLTAGLSAVERVSLGLPPFPPLLHPSSTEFEGEGGCFECPSAQQAHGRRPA